MSVYLVNLLSLPVWHLIFITSFFFGLFFFIFIIIGAMSHDSADADSGDDLHSDVHGDAHFDHQIDHDLNADLDSNLDTSVDAHLDMDGDAQFNISTDIDMDSGLDHDMMEGMSHDSLLDHDDGLSSVDTHIDSNLDHDFDGDLNPDANVDLDSNIDSDLGEAHYQSVEGEVDHKIIKHDDDYEERSSFLMGNISVFLLVWGQIGLLNINNLDDFTLLIAFVAGYISSKIFSEIIAKFAKNVVIPIKYISRGDIAEVIYGITQIKQGMAQVTRRDGVVSTIIARGVYPHDIFEKGEKGYVIGKEDEIYLITKGLITNPKLEKTSKKKALDLLDNQYT